MTSVTPCAAAAPAGRLSPRAVVTAVFFAFAIGIGLWAGSVPSLMRVTGLDARGLGLALALHSAAYIGAMAGGGQLARHVPPRRLMMAALLVCALSCVALFGARTPLVLGAALAVFGLGAGLLDLAMNTEGAAVERDLGRPVLLSMHASASASFAIGALSGSVISHLVGPPACAAVVLAVLLPVALALKALGPRAPAAPAATAMAAAGGRAGMVRGVLPIGVVLGLTVSAEMAAQMWSARLLERLAADLAVFAGAGAALFSGVQALTRLGGDGLRHRFDDRQVILGSVALAALGFAIVAASVSFAGSLVGFAAVGAGTACVVPCAFAILARRGGARAAAAIGTASLVGGMIRTPSPIALGFVAAAWSEPAAFAGVAAGLLIAWLVARAGLG